MFTTLRRTTREFVLGHGSSASALRAAPAGTASSPRPRTRGTGIAEDPAERATAEARQPSQDRVPRHLTSSLDDRHLPTYAPTLMHEASFKVMISFAGSNHFDSDDGYFQIEKYRDQFWTVRMRPIHSKDDLGRTGLYCYVKKSSEAGKVIVESLKDGGEHSALVQVRYSDIMLASVLCWLQK